MEKEDKEMMDKRKQLIELFKKLEITHVVFDSGERKSLSWLNKNFTQLLTQYDAWPLS